MDDGAKTIYTAGVSASGTEAGAGAGVSGSLAMTAGSFTSKEDAAGLYCAMGGSICSSTVTSGISVGGDMVFNMNHKHIGTTGSFGLGVGPSLLETHTRCGVTGITSFINKSSATP